AQGGKVLFQAIQDLQQDFGIYGNGIPITEKYFFHIPIILASHLNIFFNFLQRPDPVTLVLVHTAKGTLVVGTADGALQQIAVGFTKGSEYVSFIAHNWFSSPFL